MFLKKNAKNSPVVYADLVNDAIANIENGSWAPGERIIGEYELAQQYGISRSSVRLALQHLEKSGIIVKRPGKGSFVRDAGCRPQPAPVNLGINVRKSKGGLPVAWFDSKIINAVLAVCEQNNAHLTIFDDSNPAALNPDFLQGVIIIGWNRPVEAIRALAAGGIEPVLFSRITEDENINYVAADYRRESKNAALYLIRQGVRRLGCFIAENDTGTDPRVAGVRDAIAENPDVTLSPVIGKPEQSEKYYQQMWLQALTAPDRPDGIFINNASLALPAMRAIQELDLHIPRDIKTICFDDIDYLNSMFNCSSPYIKMELEQMAGDATCFLLDKIRRRRNDCLKKIYGTTIVEPDESA